MEGSAWGGSEELWSRTAAQLRAAGHQVGACIAQHPGPQPAVDALRRVGVEIHARRAVPTSLANRIWRRVIRRPPVSSLDVAMRWVVQWKPDLVCISQGGAIDGVPWMTACRAAGLNYVSLSQANTPHAWVIDSRLEPATNAYLGARRAYFVSPRNLHLLEDQLGVVLPRAAIVRNPFNVAPDVTNAWPAENGEWFLACVARLDPGAKGQDLLLHVLAEPHWRSEPLKVRFFGRGPCEQGLRRLARRLGLNNVEFAGYNSDIAGLWSQHHALVLPSRYEGLPLALVEAMLCARPAIVTDVDGNTDMIQEGVQGFIAPAPTVGFLDEALQRAWKNRARWREMGQAARERVLKLVPADPPGTFAAELAGMAEGRADSVLTIIEKIPANRTVPS